MAFWTKFIFVGKPLRQQNSTECAYGPHMSSKEGNICKTFYFNYFKFVFSLKTDDKTEDLKMKNLFTVKSTTSRSYGGHKEASEGSTHPVWFNFQLLCDFSDLVVPLKAS